MRKKGEEMHRRENALERRQADLDGLQAALEVREETLRQLEESVDQDKTDLQRLEEEIAERDALTTERERKVAQDVQEHEAGKAYAGEELSRREEQVQGRGIKLPWFHTCNMPRLFQVMILIHSMKWEGNSRRIFDESFYREQISKKDQVL